ncbi:hypothetical protein CHS0354_034150 [Potamilus streckersoni]|uniref:Cytochrome P450 n=1 Tax=Potamilus streckersoni TaxID=2493646 RepID=A0AAE0VK33_9BIVA|nr:hypothetical protein CHS0354_034150 [Potamilus streckersoni]
MSMGCCSLWTIFTWIFWSFLIFLLILVIYDQLWCLSFGMTIPGPRQIPIFGNLIEVIRSGAYESELQNTKKYGRVYSVRAGGIYAINVSDLDLLKKIFVKNFNNFSDRHGIEGSEPWPMNKSVLVLKGSDWTRVRKIMTPTFSSGKLKLMIPEINRCGVVLAKIFQKNAQSKSSVDLKQLCGGFTMDVIASTAFGIQTNSIENPDDPFVSLAQKVFCSDAFAKSGVVLSVLFPRLAPLMTKLGLGYWPNDSVQFFVSRTKEIIEDRKKGINSGRVDFIQLLLDAEEEMQEENKESGSHSSSKRLDMGEILGQAFLFFIAGYDTTATLLTFFLYVMAVHPEIQEKLTEELDSVLGKEEPNYDNIHELKYLEQVISETLRMYPPLLRMSRIPSETVIIDGYKFPKGVGVLYSIYQIHHDPEYYHDPEEFMPDRFTPEARANAHPLSFLSFGYGPRNCIGMRLALVEAKIAIVHILRSVKIVPCLETEIPLKVNLNGSIIRPFKPIKVGVELRQ